MSHRSFIAAVILGAAAAGVQAQPAAAGAAPSVEHGRYLVQISGCNDCHTAGYGMKAGQVPESDWLKGDALGWRGAWGTTYASNLRLSFARMSEAEWMKLARDAELRPPMPWFSLRVMTERDLMSIWRFVRSLGPAGEPAPAYVPPGQAPLGPVVSFPTP